MAAKSLRMFSHKEIPVYVPAQGNGGKILVYERPQGNGGNMPVYERP